MKLIVGDDHPIFGALLGQLLVAAGHTLIIHDLDVHAALQASENRDVDVVVLGLGVTSLSSLNTPCLLRLQREAGVVLLLPGADRRLVGRARLLPVSGIAMKEDDFHDVLHVISEAAARRWRPIGQVALSSGARAALDEQRSHSSVWSLTCREQEILCRLAAGEPTAGVATAMGVRVTTVRTHVASMLRKLDAHTLVEAVAVARRFGVLDEVRRPAPRAAARDAGRAATAAGGVL